LQKIRYNPGFCSGLLLESVAGYVYDFEVATVSYSKRRQFIATIKITNMPSEKEWVPGGVHWVGAMVVGQWATDRATFIGPTGIPSH